MYVVLSPRQKRVVPKSVGFNLQSVTHGNLRVLPDKPATTESESPRTLRMRKRVERRKTRAFNQAMTQSPTATAIEVVRTAQVIAQQENDTSSDDEELSDESDFGFDHFWCCLFGQ